MSSVSFYIIQENSPFDRSDNGLFSLVAKICEKALKTKTAVCVFTKTADLGEIDTALWAYQEASFLTHSINQPSDTLNITDKLDNAFSGILVNLTDEALTASAASRIIEIIERDEQKKQQGRSRYKDYHQLKFDIQDFKV